MKSKLGAFEPKYILSHEFEVIIVIPIYSSIHWDLRRRLYHSPWRLKSLLFKGNWLKRRNWLVCCLWLGGTMLNRRQKLCNQLKLKWGSKPNTTSQEVSHKNITTKRKKKGHSQFITNSPPLLLSSSSLYTICFLLFIHSRPRKTPSRRRNRSIWTRAITPPHWVDYGNRQAIYCLAVQVM